MKSHIEIIVSPMGDISIDAIGFKGADCEQATRFMEEALGTVSARNRKPEYLQPTTARRQQKVGS